MKIQEISDLVAPGIAPYVGLTDREMRRSDIFVAESPKVISTALDSGLKPLSFLCERKHIEGDAADLISRSPDITVYTGSRELLASITGYTLTRGVLCAMKRPEPLDAASLLSGAKRVCVVYDVCDSTNVGVIFRTAAALGYDAVILSSTSCDPLNRRVIRVSMGTVFRIPWAMVPDVPGLLKETEFKSVSMALTERSVSLEDFSVDVDERYALLLGSEGYGLPQKVIDGSDVVIRIPMHYGVDSLNVGAAAAIALWTFRK